MSIENLNDKPNAIPALAPATCSARLLKAAKDADWMQVVYNQGPPCFHLEDDRLCLRAERWDGHKTIGGSNAIHEYVSLESLLRSIAPNDPSSATRPDRDAGAERKHGN